MDVLCLLSWALLTLLLACVAALFQFSHPRVYWMMRKIPTFSKVPIIGEAIIFAQWEMEDILENIKKHTKSENIDRYTSGTALGIPVVLLFHPDDVEVVLSCPVNIKKGFHYFPLKSWLREGLLVSDGHKWRQRRKLLTPTFHFRILEDNVGQVAHHSDMFVEKLLGYAGEPIPLDDEVKKYTLDVICETAMGINMNAQRNESAGYVQAIIRASKTVVMRSIKLWLIRDWIFNLTNIGRMYEEDIKTIHGFSEKVISERKKEKEKERGHENTKMSKKRKAFLDLLLETDEKNPGLLSLLDIREEVDTFMFEGHDTTSAAITFALYSIAAHPQVQEQILEEQRQIFGSEERVPTLQDLNDMTYLEMVIKEVLRLYPSVPFTSRVLVKDTTLGSGVTLAAGTNVVIMPYFVHRNEEFWEEPEEFRPERFLPGQQRHPYSYIPFSAGPRNCIGMRFAMLEIKTTISKVVRRCHIEPVTKKIKLAPVVILRSVSPIFIKVIPRKYT